LSDSSSEVRLQEFERRWQHDRSPRVFLQFADELRRAGRTTRAIEILTEGLEHHPDSVSGMVALGRTLLEAREPEHARTFLERAVERDPSQYVANRLLVECALRLYDASGARERLEICRLLNDRDPELVSLAEEIDALEGERGEEPRPSLGTEPPTASAGRPIFELPEPDRLPSLELPKSGAPADVAASDRRARPFGYLGEAAEARARILSHFRSEGIFASAPAALSAATEPSSGTVADAEPRAVAEASGATPIVLPDREAAMPATEALIASAEPVAPSEEPAPVETPAEPMFSLQSIGAEVESEHEAPTGDLEAPAEAAQGDGFEELPEVEPRTASSTTGAAAADTATLGNLYLAQGHLDEAERAFRAALDRHSDDAVARRGLEEIERRRAAAVVPTPHVAGGGPTQRKIVLLSDWMNRLRSERLARRVDVS